MNPGQKGEQFVSELCRGALTRDFVFTNVKYWKGKKTRQEKELCDALIWFEDTLIVVQVKTADPAVHGDWTIEEKADWANKKIEEAVDQVRGAISTVLKGMVAELENPWQGRVPFDHRTSVKVYGMVVVDHPPMTNLGRGPVVDVGGRKCAVLTTSHGELANLFTELSTIGDFIDYLSARESFFETSYLVGASELDLLAVYKGDPEEFMLLVEKKEQFMILPGSWEALARHPQRWLRDEADRNSFIVDLILDHMHEGLQAENSHLAALRAEFGTEEDRQASYRGVMIQLARLRRVERRDLGDEIVKKSKLCLEQGRDRWGAVGGADDDAVILFLISTLDREQRARFLTALTGGVKLLAKRRVACGFALAPIFAPGFSVDAVLIEGDPREEERAAGPEGIDAAREYFPRMRNVQLQEFPDVPPQEEK